MMGFAYLRRGGHAAPKTGRDSPERKRTEIPSSRRTFSRCCFGAKQKLNRRINAAGPKPFCVGSPDQIIGRPIWDSLLFEDRGTVKQHYEHIQQRNKELMTLYTIAEMMGRAGDLDVVFIEVLEAVLELDWLGVDRSGTLCLVDSARQTFRPVARRGVPLGHPYICTLSNLENCICGFIVHTGNVVITTANKKETHGEENYSVSHRIISLPIMAYGKIL